MLGDRTARVAVFGAGAVGGYFGGRLAQAGQNVTFIARGAHLDAIQRHGLQVVSVKGDFVVNPATATDDASSVGVVDVVLVAVKAGTVSAVAPSLKPMLGTHTVVVPLQNGVEATSHLMAALGSKPVIGGLCRIVASVTSPGRITHAGIEPTVIVGELDGSTSERVGLLRDLLSEAGVAVEVADDIQAALWEKFLLIAPWGGLGGLTRVTLDVLCGTPETRRLLAQSMGEVAAVAAAHGVRLVPDIVDRTMRFLAQVPAGGTASMQRDIMERRPSELEAQVGAIVRLGRDKSVDTPINTLVYECLLAGERIARGEA
ncbi:MAG: 2-dehydropantoate 2-reductase [bacterium]